MGYCTDVGVGVVWVWGNVLMWVCGVGAGYCTDVGVVWVWGTVLMWVWVWCGCGVLY